MFLLKERCLSALSHTLGKWSRREATQEMERWLGKDVIQTNTDVHSNELQKPLGLFCKSVPVPLFIYTVPQQLLVDSFFTIIKTLLLLQLFQAATMLLDLSGFTV